MHITIVYNITNEGHTNLLKIRLLKPGKRSKVTRPFSYIVYSEKVLFGDEAKENIEGLSNTDHTHRNSAILAR